MKKIQKNDGFTLIELLIVVAIIGIIAAIAVPGLLKARQSGNEASAIGSVRAISSAEATYAASCGGGGYAQSLAALAAPANGVPFVSPDLMTAGVPKSGYQHILAPNAGPQQNLPILPAAMTCNMVADSITNYFVGNAPVTPGSTGQRAFASDNRGTIFQEPTGAGVANPIPAAAQILQ